MSSVGQPVRRVDALGKVTGEALFPGDIHLPNSLAAKILFAGRPHAVIRRVDTGEAERLPGVVAIFTARDVPVNEYGLIMPDQPVLVGSADRRSGALSAIRWRWSSRNTSRRGCGAQDRRGI
jgi:CO/xanthine dehydrogenase Mo-binding subunit